MNWLEAAQAAPSLELSDIVHLEASAEESAKLVAIYARSLSNARSDSADIAMIALKKVLSEHPGWGEAALLYGICLALDGKLKRAKASFEHALSVGLVSENTTYLAQMCYREAAIFEEQLAQPPESEKAPSFFHVFGGILPSRKPSIYEESDPKTSGRMRAPILTRAPKSAAKARLATDRERREVLMQSNASSEKTDEEIDVSIPKTPAEKLRLFLSVTGIIVAAALLGLLVWFIVIPAVHSIGRTLKDTQKKEFLVQALLASKDDAEVQKILAAYESLYPDDITLPAEQKSATNSSPAEENTTEPIGSTENTEPAVSDTAATGNTAPTDTQTTTGGDTAATVAGSDTATGDTPSQESSAATQTQAQ